ncbi:MULTISPECIES: hypothetical protein [Lactobacillus]|uniref:hypothetical protein n=1 Tax=Lactobacillus TaxID=1578 RepID=UPI002490EFEF|nr:MULTISPECIES: hypothetical protein [Lactobacillus]
MRKIVRFVSSIVLSIGLLGAIGQVAAADGGSSAPQFGSAEVAPTNPTIKKGNKIIVIVKDTKNQKVAVYNKNAQKTNKTVKMGSIFTAKAVKKTNGKKIVQVKKNSWLNSKDVTKY